MQKHLLCDPVIFQCEICLRAFESGEKFNNHLLNITARVEQIEEARKAIPVQPPRKKQRRERKKFYDQHGYPPPPEPQQLYCEPEFKENLESPAAAVGLLYQIPPQPPEEAVASADLAEIVDNE